MDKPTVGHQYRVWFTNAIPPKEVTVLSVWTGAEAMAGGGELSHELATAVFFTGEEGELYETSNIEKMEDLGPGPDYNNAEIVDKGDTARAISAWLLRYIEENDPG